jgi:hypothetical protein
MFTGPQDDGILFCDWISNDLLDVTERNLDN